MNSTLKKLAVKSVLSLAMVFALAFAAVGVSASYNTTSNTGYYQTITSTYNSSNDVTATLYAKDTNTYNATASKVRARNIKKNISSGSQTTISTDTRNNVPNGGNANTTKTGVGITGGYKYGAEGYEEIYINGTKHTETKTTFSHTQN